MAWILAPRVNFGFGRDAVPDTIRLYYIAGIIRYALPCVRTFQKCRLQGLIQIFIMGQYFVHPLHQWVAQNQVSRTQAAAVDLFCAFMLTP